MYIHCYRSWKFEKTSKDLYAQYGTFYLVVRPDLRTADSELARLWRSNLSRRGRNQQQIPALSVYDDWRRMCVFDIGKKPLFLNGHSAFFNMFDISNLSEEIQYNIYSGKSYAEIHVDGYSLLDHLRGIFRLSEDDMEAITEPYLWPSEKSKTINAQDFMTTTIELRIRNILSDLEYRCVKCS